MIDGGDPFYLKFWVELTALERNRRFFKSLFAHIASAVTPSEKSSINTSRKSHYALFNEPKMNIVRGP